MNRMRLRIAERLKQSQNTAASLTTFNEVDMSSIMEFRKLYKDEILKSKGVKLGFMSAFSRACILAMRDVPAVNASIEGPNGGDTIVYRDYVDISVAVATEKGLVTPVVRNAESLDMVGIEGAIAELGKKARDIHHLERRCFWQLDGHSDYQPATNCCAGSACDQGQASCYQWQSRDQAGRSTPMMRFGNTC
jgi:pyruvate/2-oxoglutarate dehydrogenase complex dihydrolipoamide acyltransferase (E2) component